MLISILRRQCSHLVAAVALSVCGVSTALSAQAVTDALVPTSGRARAVPVDRFTPDLAIPDTVFECGPTEVRAADVMLPVNAIVYYASVPNQANPRVSMVVFADSAGKIIRFAERRGEPIRPDTRGLSPAQVAQAVQAAAIQSRSTLITVDYTRNSGSATNRGGGRDDTMTIAAPDVIANLEVLGKPGEFAARVASVCSQRKP